MKVSFTVPTTRHHPSTGQGSVAIEFAIPDQGGNSSAGVRHNYIEKSVRLAWWRDDGGFDPISSSELPDWGVMDVMEACAANDFFSPQQIAQIIKVLSESLDRQGR